MSHLLASRTLSDGDNGSRRYAGQVEVEKSLMEIGETQWILPSLYKVASTNATRSDAGEDVAHDQAKDTGEEAAHFDRAHGEALGRLKRPRPEHECDESCGLNELGAAAQLRHTVAAAAAKLQSTYDRRDAIHRRVFDAECATMQTELRLMEDCVMAREQKHVESYAQLQTAFLEEQRKSADLSRQLAQLSTPALPVNGPTLEDVYERIVSKLSRKYMETFAFLMMQEKHIRGQHAWVVMTDEGPVPLRACVLLNILQQVRHRAAHNFPLGISPGSVWKAIDSTASHTYDVEFVSETKAIQINTETGKRRDIVYVPFSDPYDTRIEMNDFAIPCHDGAKFLLAEEYADLRRLVPCATSQRTCTPAFHALSNVFGSVFSGMHNYSRKTSFLSSEHLLEFARRACIKKNAVIRIVAHGTAHATEIAVNGFDTSFSKNGAKGVGIYVAQNDYIPRTWALRSRASAPSASATFSSAVVLGALVDVNADVDFVVPYRMSRRGGEPAGWKERSVNHAMCVRSVEHVGLVALGACWL